MQKRAVATVIKVKPVVIDGQKTNLGQYGGAIIGGAAAIPGGGAIGGRGDALVMAGASLVGAIAGQAVEELATRKKAQEITVEMPNGDVYVIVQPSPPDFQVGDKVHVISGPNGARLELALDF
jgi:outer membrane lipoprotein SlyB